MSDRSSKTLGRVRADGMLESMLGNPFLTMVFEDGRLRVYCCGLDQEQRAAVESIVREMT